MDNGLIPLSIFFYLRAMRARLLAITWLFFLLVPFWLYFAILQWEKEEVRHEVKEKIIEGMDRDELELLTFTKKESKNLYWEHSKEFKYQGEMYDIVERRTTQDSVYFWCWWDREESRLNQKLTNLVSGKVHSSPEQKNNQKRYFQFVEHLFYRVKEDFLRPDLAFPSEKNIFHYSFFLKETYLQPLLQPPLHSTLGVCI